MERRRLREEKTREHFRKLIQLMTHIAKNVDRYRDKLPRMRVRGKTLYVIDEVETQKLSLHEVTLVCATTNGKLVTVTGSRIEEANEKKLEELYMPKGKEYLRPKVKKLRKLVAQTEPEAEPPLDTLK